MTAEPTPADPPMPDRLAAEIREALTRTERGETVDLGSFAEYADDADVITEWAVLPPGCQSLTPYDEDLAKRTVRSYRQHGMSATLYRRTVGPWKEVPPGDPETPTEGES